MCVETSSCSRDQSCSQTPNFWSLPWASLTSSHCLHLLSCLNNLERIETGTIYALSESQTFWVEMLNLSGHSKRNILHRLCAYARNKILQSSPKGTKLDAILHPESLSRPSSLSPSLTSLEAMMRSSIVADFREKNDVLFRACSRTDMWHIIAQPANVHNRRDLRLHSKPFSMARGMGTSTFGRLNAWYAIYFL